MRPLDPLSSIKFKLGVIIVAAIGVTVLRVHARRSGGVPAGARRPGLGALALVVVQILARGMTSPLREMATASRAMARGDYSRRVTATSRDEVGELARAFNAMAAELAETDRMRRDLVANVSHELRTPISALRASLENLVDGVEPPDADRSERCSPRSSAWAGWWTSCSICRAWRPGWRRWSDGGSGCDEVLTGVVEESAHARGERRRSRCASRSSRASCGSRRSRADPPGGGQPPRQRDPPLARRRQRELRASAGNGQVAIEVEDQGPGIRAERRDRVFERFYRADRARSATRRRQRPGPVDRPVDRATCTGAHPG